MRSSYDVALNTRLKHHEEDRSEAGAAFRWELTSFANARDSHSHVLSMKTTWSNSPLHMWASYIMWSGIAFYWLFISITIWPAMISLHSESWERKCRSFIINYLNKSRFLFSISSLSRCVSSSLFLPWWWFRWWIRAYSLVDNLSNHKTKNKTHKQLWAESLINFNHNNFIYFIFWLHKRATLSRRYDDYDSH